MMLISANQHLCHIYSRLIELPYWFKTCFNPAKGGILTQQCAKDNFVVI